MAISKHAYLFNPAYRVIANRLMERHKIDLNKHIDTMYEIGTRPGQGITFEVKLWAERAYEVAVRTKARNIKQ